MITCRHYAVRRMAQKHAVSATAMGGCRGATWVALQGRLTVVKRQELRRASTAFTGNDPLAF